MWIHQATELGKSSATNVNLLWQDDALPIYIMDNHRLALWCWRRHLRRTDTYDLVHLDAHWDGEAIAGEGALLLEAKWDALDDLGTFCALEDPSDPKLPLVRWDNYIDPLFRMYENLHECHVTTHQGDALFERSTFHGRPRCHRDSLHEFFSYFNETLNVRDQRIVVNIDLDYFFSRHSGDGPMQAFGDEFIRRTFSAVREKLGKITVLTIALSPECCGGWSASGRAAAIACDALGIAGDVPSLLARG